jgi:hypothetical protein
LADWIRNLRTRDRIKLEIVRRNPETKGFEVSPWRWIVERTFAWLSFNRRFSKGERIMKLRLFDNKGKVIKEWDSFELRVNYLSNYFPERETTMTIRNLNIENNLRQLISKHFTRADEIEAYRVLDMIRERAVEDKEAMRKKVTQRGKSSGKKRRTKGK